MGDIQINSSLDISTMPLGNEANPLLYVDDFLSSPNEMITYGAQLKWAQIGPHYPGPRAALPKQITQSLIDQVSKLTGGGTPFPAFTGDGFLSLVTLPPDRLQPIQRLPHFDGLEDERMAAIIYLSRTDFGGTNFYRQKETGFETVTAERFDTYRAHLHKSVEEYGMPPAAYASDGAPHFDLIHSVESQFNRLIVYKGNQLHSGAISSDHVPLASVLNGRLTLNLFFWPNPE